MFEYSNNINIYRTRIDKMLNTKKYMELASLIKIIMHIKTYLNVIITFTIKYYYVYYYVYNKILLYSSSNLCMHEIYVIW